MESAKRWPPRPAGLQGGISEPAGAPLSACRTQLVLAGILLTGVFGALACRLYDIQVRQHPELSARVERMLASSAEKPGRRGDILLRDGSLWAREVTRYLVAMDPTRMPAAAQTQALETICRTLDVADEVRREKLARLDEAREGRGPAASRPLRYLPLARGVKPETVEEIKAQLAPLFGAPEIPGLVLRPAHHREYPRGAVLGSVLGGTVLGASPEEIAGAAGLELSLDRYLSGWDGHRKGMKDGLQRTRFAWTSDIDIPPVDGYNVVLTIDGRVQKIVEEELAEGVRRARGEAGLALVLDTADGDVLAMASYPAYDPNHFNHYLPEEFRERRKNRVVENLYEPGSTIKPIWAAAALESGLFKPEQLVWGGGKTTTVLGRPVSDVSDHGAMTFADAIVYSSNVGMVLVGLKLGKERLDEALSRFHFQARTGIPLPGEESGWRMPLARWKDSTTTISASMGFAFNLTPIQLGAAYVSLVNGGRYFTPRLIDRIESKTRVHRFPVIDKGRTVGESTSSRLRDILHRAVEEGTGKQARVPGLPFGGKTGTAPISKGRRGYAAGGAKEYLSSFVAFAPYPDPEIVLLVMVEKPKGAYYGSTVCGPIVRETLKRIFGIDSEVAKN